MGKRRAKKPKMQGANIHAGYLDEQMTSYMSGAERVSYHAAIDKDGRMHVDLAGEDVVVDKSFQEYLENKPIIDANKVTVPIVGGKGWGKSNALQKAIDEYKEEQAKRVPQPDPMDALKKAADAALAARLGGDPKVAAQYNGYAAGGMIGTSQGLMQVLPTTFSNFGGNGPLTEEEKLKIQQRTEKSEQAKRARDPRYWAHNAEDKINGVLQQARNNLGPAHPTTILLNAMSEALSDHVFQLGGE